MRARWSLLHVHVCPAWWSEPQDRPGLWTYREFYEVFDGCRHVVGGGWDSFFDGHGELMGVTVRTGLVNWSKSMENPELGSCVYQAFSVGLLSTVRPPPPQGVPTKCLVSGRSRS